ncbi:helix-turn-helix domain-containing protein [Nocardia thailandica]
MDPDLAPRPVEWPLTRAEHARRLGVSPSAITRALAAAEARHHADPSQPAPPAPVNPGQPHPRYWRADFDTWWAARPRRGRPTSTTPPAGETA